MSKVLLPCALAELWRFAGSDISRKNLMRVQVGVHEGRQFAAATDGHRLMCATVKKPLGSDPYIEALIEGAALKAICKAAGRGKAQQPIWVEDNALEAGTTRIALVPDPTMAFPDWRVGLGWRSVLDEPTDADPRACKECGLFAEVTDYQTVCNECDTLMEGLVVCSTCQKRRAPKHDPSVGVDARYVGDVGEYLKVLGHAPHIIMRLNPQAPAVDPIGIETNDLDPDIAFQGLIMPVRL